MGDETTTQKAKTADAAAPKNKDTSNDWPGPDFVQRELTPEQMPASAKVPSPATQVNTSGTSAIGTSGADVIDSADEAIAEGVEAYKGKNDEVVKAAQKLADDHRKLDEAAGDKVQ